MEASIKAFPHMSLIFMEAAALYLSGVPSSQFKAAAPLSSLRLGFISTA